MHEVLEKSYMQFEHMVITRRENIVTVLEINPTVFKNMNGFIKFRSSTNPLEQTRINKECKFFKVKMEGTDCSLL